MAEPKKKITVPLSQSDLEDLMAGEDFHWTFIVEGGFEEIDVHVKPEEEEDIM